MNEMLDQFAQNLSSLEPTTTGGTALAVFSVAYLAYNHVKNKKKSNQSNSNDETNHPDEKQDVNEITMETKYFNLDDSSSGTEMTTFKELDGDSFKRPVFNPEIDKDNSFKAHQETDLNLPTSSVLEDNSIDFIEESNKQFDKISLNETLLPKNKVNTIPAPDLELNAQSTPETIVHEPLSINSFEVLKNSIPVEDVQLNEENLNQTETNLSTPLNSKIQVVNNLHNDHKNESNELLKFAFEADSFSNKKDAITYLNQAIQTEMNLTEKVRLKIILQTYLSTNKSLTDIFNDIPSIQNVKNLETKPEPIRFVNPDHLKFIDDNSLNIESEKNEEANPLPPILEEVELTHENLDMSDLLAVPQDDEESKPVLTYSAPVEFVYEEKTPQISTAEHPKEEHHITEKINEALTMPSLSDVTFGNVDTQNLDDKNHLETFLENLVIDIDKDNSEVERNKQLDEDLTNSVLQEVYTKEPLLSDNHLFVHNLPTEDEIDYLPALTSSIPEISESSDKALKEKSSCASDNVHVSMKLEDPKDTYDLFELNFKDMNQPVKEDDKNLQNEPAQTKVWVNLIIKNNEQTEYVNKKFQITGNFGSIDGNTSLNRQVNAWVKKTYNTLNYVITFVAPVN